MAKNKIEIPSAETAGIQEIAVTNQIAGNGVAIHSQIAVGASANMPMQMTASSQTIKPDDLSSIKSATRTTGKAKAIDVAKFLVYLAACEDEPDFLSHLRLQKLLYYVQGWSLAMRNKPMFVERIEAWAHGPVVKDVYAVLSACGRRPISIDDVGQPEGLTEDEMEFIQSVWTSYKQFSASSLREMTHKDDPWLDARKGFGPTDRCENEITQKALKDFFAKAIKKN